MKVAYRNRSPEVQDRMRHRLEVAINDLRRAVAWDWQTLNEYCVGEFGRISQEMSIEDLFRLYKDLYELNRFLKWRQTRG